MKFILTMIIVLITSVSMFSQKKYDGTVKENPLKKTEKAVFVEPSETIKLEKVQFDSEIVSGQKKQEETLLHKLQMCESRIAHSSTDELNIEYNKLRNEFVEFVQNSNLDNLTVSEKTKYMSLMKEEDNLDEYTRARNSLRNK